MNIFADTYKLKRTGLVAKILTWHIDDTRQAAEREKEIIFAHYATRGVCAAFGRVISQSLSWILWKIFETVMTVGALVVLTIFVLPVRLLFKGERLDYGWFNTMRGQAFVPISWMPKDGKKTVGPLATKKARMVWGGLFVAYILTATVISFGESFGWWNIRNQNDIPNLVTVLVYAGAAIAGIIALIVVVVVVQNLIDFLKDQEVKSLAKAQAEAKRRRFCPQIVWVD